MLRETAAAALYGPRHGGANEAVIRMLTEIGSIDNVPAFIKDVKAGNIYSSVALQFAADMKQSFDTLVKMQSDPKAKGEVLVTPQKIITSS